MGRKKNNTPFLIKSIIVEITKRWNSLGIKLEDYLPFKSPIKSANFGNQKIIKRLSNFQFNRFGKNQIS